MNNKDYLLLAEKSGKLNILSRVGKDRVKVTEKFDFSEIPVAREGSNFVIITKDQKKYSISQSGKVSLINLDVSSSYDFQMRGTRSHMGMNRIGALGLRCERGSLRCS